MAKRRLGLSAVIAAGAMAALAAFAAPALARDSLGVFEDWAAFRDPAAPRCYAIAQPDETSGSGYATVSFWPRARVRGQLYFRLARNVGQGSTATVTLNGQRFVLMVRGNGAWARDARTDAGIVAAMRSAPTMRLSVSPASGGGFGAAWRLRGAATAIDAAALGCAGRR